MTDTTEVRTMDLATGIQIVPERDGKLTDFARKLLTDFYLRPGETPQTGFARAARAWSGGDMELAQRLYDAASKGWFMFASPVLSNAPLPGEKIKGLPISCFLTYVDDSIEGLNDHTVEVRWLSVLGGGVGGHWSGVRSVSDKAPGPIPFMHCADADMSAFMQGKCYSPDTEVMTARGWVRFDTLTKDDLIGQVDQSLRLSFVKPNELVEETHEGALIHVKTPNGAVDLLVTPNHSMVVEDRQRLADGTKAWKGTLRNIRADSLPSHADVRFHTAARLSGGSARKLTPEERFHIAFQADGHNHANGSGASFHFSKQRKIDRLCGILNDAGIHHSVNPQQDGTTSVYIPAPVRGTKMFEDWCAPANMSGEWCEEFLEELRHWDAASQDETRGFTYMTTVKSNADMVQAIAALAGKTSRLTLHEDRGGNRVPLYTVYIRDYAPLTLQNVETTEAPYSGKVYCALVDTGMLLVRRNGVVTVCGNTRKGSYAAYLDISHPDVVEFVGIRTPTGDESRKCLGQGFHHAVNITDAFMEAVIANKPWDLIDPNDKKVRETVPARLLWEQILETRYRTGEPYLNFIDTANRALPEALKEMGLKIHGSNLCNEIHLPTGPDRTAVCCLSSLNLELYDEWKDTALVGDLIEMLDNVLTYFIENAPAPLSRAVHSASRSRDLGLGRMGWHSYLQKRNIAFESDEAVAIGEEISKEIWEKAVDRSLKLGAIKGEAPDMAGTGRRNAHLLATAPNANSSILLGTSPSDEVAKANAYKHQTRVGTWPVKNHHLEAVLERHGRNDEATWKDIIVSKGSVQHLDFLTDHEKEVFKTAIEIDQIWVVRHAAVRQRHIDQGQSVNLFFPPRADRSYLNRIHTEAWKQGLKGLYYLRTEAKNRADNVSVKQERVALSDGAIYAATSDKSEECVACQG